MVTFACVKVSPHEYVSLLGVARWRHTGKIQVCHLTIVCVRVEAYGYAWRVTARMPWWGSLCSLGDTAKRLS